MVLEWFLWLCFPFRGGGVKGYQVTAYKMGLLQYYHNFAFFPSICQLVVWEERCFWAWLGQEGIQEWTLSWDHKSDSYGPGFLPCFPPRPLGLFGASTSICPSTSWVVGNSWRWLFPYHRWRNWSTKRQSSLNRCSHSVTWSVGFVPCRLYPKPDNKPSYIYNSVQVTEYRHVYHSLYSGQ